MPSPVASGPGFASPTPLQQDTGPKDHNRKIQAWITPAEREQQQEPVTFKVSPFSPQPPAGYQQQQGAPPSSAGFKPVQFSVGVFDKGKPQPQRQPGVFLANGGPASPQQSAPSPTPAAAPSPQPTAAPAGAGEDTSTDF